jgi:hypothetical protein
MKKVVRVVLAALLTLAVVPLVAGCNVQDAVSQFLEGNVSGQVGKEYKTIWFNFTIKSIDKVQTYQGKTAPAGYEYIDVVVSETNTFDEPLPMGTFDWYVDAPSFREYVDPENPWHSSMMPTEFTLKIGETQQYHMIFEVPTGTSGLKLVYEEIDEKGSTHSTFTIDIK